MTSCGVPRTARAPRLCTAVVLAAIVPLALETVACTRRSSGPGAARAPAARRVVVDMRGVSVGLPDEIHRVATIDDGLVESVMMRLGVIDRVVVIGSWALKREYSYRVAQAGAGGTTYQHGMSTIRFLNPRFATLPCAGSEDSDAISYETIAAARPDVVLLRVGDCTVGASPDVVTRATAVLEGLGIPLVVVRAASAGRARGTTSMRDEIRTIGEVFGRQHEAIRFADELNVTERFVRERVAAVPDAARPTALYLGLTSGARRAGGAALVWGRDTTESWMLEQVAGGRNAFRGTGAQIVVNVEQLLALDPDVIFLPTSAGYHPPIELYEAPSYRLLRGLKAVRTRRVFPLPWTPYNCAHRVEYPIDLIILAKALYPERFSDIRVHEWVVGFYRGTYGVDEKSARGLRSAQWLDWTVEAGF